MILFDFDNDPITFYFGPAGSFQFAVEDVRLNLNHPTAPNDGRWYGQVTNATANAIEPAEVPSRVPEPGSLCLLGAGITAIAGTMRRRRT